MIIICLLLFKRNKLLFHLVITRQMRCFSILSIQCGVPIISHIARLLKWRPHRLTEHVTMIVWIQLLFLFRPESVDSRNKDYIDRISGLWKCTFGWPNNVTFTYKRHVCFVGKAYRMLLVGEHSTSRVISTSIFNDVTWSARTYLKSRNGFMYISLYFIWSYVV